MDSNHSDYQLCNQPYLHIYSITVETEKYNRGIPGWFWTPVANCKCSSQNWQVVGVYAWGMVWGFQFLRVSYYPYFSEIRRKKNPPLFIQKSSTQNIYNKRLYKSWPVQATFNGIKQLHLNEEISSNLITFTKLWVKKCCPYITSH